jgi:hypothetical protein
VVKGGRLAAWALGAGAVLIVGLGVWAANAMNLALIGAAWVVADRAAGRR